MRWLLPLCLLATVLGSGCTELADQGTQPRPTTQSSSQTDVPIPLGEIPPEAASFNSTSALATGAALANADGPLAGQLTMSSPRAGRLPFALEVTWLGSDGSLIPLFYGYELHVKHQEIEVQAGLGDSQAGIGPFAPIALEDFRIRLNVNTSGPGLLVIAWGELENGIALSWESGSSGPLERPIFQEAEFFDLVNQTDGAFVYSAAIQATSGKIPEQPGPTLAHLRLLLPSNGGSGSVRIVGSEIFWERPFFTANSSCINCYHLERHIGVLASSWHGEILYAGNGANFQAYLFVVELPQQWSTLASNTLMEFPDCVESHAGCE